MKREPLIFLLDIMESIEKIENYTNGLNEDDFSTNGQAQDAVIRRIEIIGEATKNLPNDLRKEYADVPWKEIAGMRDIITHEYFGINIKRVWNIIKEDLPPFKEQIAKIIKELGGQEAIKLK